MSRSSLTPRQNEIYEFIRTCIQQGGAPPTITEIGARFGIRSTNGVNDLLNALEKKGYIQRKRGIARGIALSDGAPAATSTKGTKKVPIVGEGESSNPFSIFMNPQGMLSPDPSLFTTANLFGALVSDDAMDGEGIFKGDYVLVKQGTPADGALVFALVGSQQLVRRMQGNSEHRHLVASNRHYKKIPYYDGGDEVAVMGEVVGVIRVL